jgi:hypothetical protein
MRQKRTKEQQSALDAARARVRAFPQTLYVRRFVNEYDYEGNIEIEYATYKTAARAIAAERVKPDGAAFFAEYELKKISRAKLEIVVDDDDDI